MKLPDIDTVWTDKTTFPYAFISYDTNGAVYSLVLSRELDVVGFSGVKFFAYKNPSIVYDCIVGEWVFASRNDNSDYSSTGWLPIWANGDIYNSSTSLDGSLFLAASDPIPLDGYNIIEWDGDTTGLISVPNNIVSYYRIADYLPMPSSAYAVNSSFSLSNGSFDNAVVYDTLSGDNDYWQCYEAVVGMGDIVSSGVGVPSGIYVSKANDIDGAVNEVYVNYFAYRSTETPPDEGGGDDDDPQPPAGG